MRPTENRRLPEISSCVHIKPSKRKRPLPPSVILPHCSSTRSAPAASLERMNQGKWSVLGREGGRRHTSAPTPLTHPAVSYSGHTMVGAAALLRQHLRGKWRIISIQPNRDTEGSGGKPNTERGGDGVRRGRTTSGLTLFIDVHIIIQI